MSDHCPRDQSENLHSSTSPFDEAEANAIRGGVPHDPEAERRFELWVNEPIEPCMIVRRYAALYQRVTFSVPGATEERMLRYACNYSKYYNVRLCFCPNRRWSYWVEPDGVLPKPVETKELFGNRPSGGLWLGDLHILRLDLADVPLSRESDIDANSKEIFG